VAKYKQYDALGNATGGIYAQIFEEEYKSIIGNMQLQLEDSEEY
jgi:type III restriction enzyme